MIPCCLEHESIFEPFFTHLAPLSQEVDDMYDTTRGRKQVTWYIYRSPNTAFYPLEAREKAAG